MHSDDAIDDAATMPPQPCRPMLQSQQNIAMASTEHDNATALMPVSTIPDDFKPEDVPIVSICHTLHNQSHPRVDP